MDLISSVFFPIVLSLDFLQVMDLTVYYWYENNGSIIELKQQIDIDMELFILTQDHCFFC